MTRIKIMTLAAAGILAFSGMAQATQFTITNNTFSNLVGDTSGFTWSVAPVADIASFNLSAGDSKTFTYGTFTTTDIADAKTVNDYFTANFLITPPGVAQQNLAILDSIHVHGNSYGVKVDADNTLNSVLFGTGGKYTVSFLDTPELDSNGSLDLQATLNLISEPTLVSDPTDPEPVPEPGTLVLLGAGFLGLATYGKRRKNV